MLISKKDTCNLLFSKACPEIGRAILSYSPDPSLTSNGDTDERQIC